MTTDPQGDDIYYLFNWGDRTYSGWLGPYPSGTTAQASHTWRRQGAYNIKVKARDSNGYESQWSDPLQVNLPKNKAQILLNLPILQKSIPIFQILNQLLTESKTSINQDSNSF
jgi:hypothetical protein